MSIIFAAIVAIGSTGPAQLQLPPQCTSASSECTKALQYPQRFTGTGIYNTPPDPPYPPNPYVYANFDSEADLIATRYAQTENLAIAEAPPYRTFCFMSSSSPGNEYGGSANWSPPNVPDQFGFLQTLTQRDHTFWYVDNYTNSLPPPCQESHFEGMQENAWAPLYCPNGWSGVYYDANVGPYCYRPKCVRCQKNVGPSTSAGNPIDVLEKIKLQTETDFSTDGLLRLQREYRSDGFAFAPGGGAPPNSFGSFWRSSYDRQLIEATGSGSAHVAQLDRADGRQLYFTEGVSSYTGNSWSPGTLKRLRDAQNNPIGWTYESDANEIETYDVTGLLTRIDQRDGRYVTIARDADGHVIGVTDERGRTLTFGYDLRDGYPGQARVNSVTLPDGNTVSYDYNYANVIVTVHLPGSTKRQYVYADQYSIVLLTSIIDEIGVTYATYTYDLNHYPLTTEHAGGVDKYQVVAGQTAAYTDPLGTQHAFTVQTIANASRITAETKTCAGCTTTAQTVHYDAAGNVDYSLDFNNNKTAYTYDSQTFVETSRTEATGTAAQRTINTIWDANFRVPDQRSVVNVNSVTEALTKWRYNTRGQTLARCDIDPTVSGASTYTCGSLTNAPTGVRQSTYTYCEQAGVTAGTCPLIGLTLSVDGPRTDVSDVTTYTYYQSTDLSGCTTLGGACHNLGDLQKVTNALNQVTTYVSYDKNGRVTRMQDANGVYTDLTYHPRGWLLTRTVRANTNGTPNATLDAPTTFGYDNVGNIIKVTQADGAYLAYTYDNAHRLYKITDNLGNSVNYTLDAAGNRIGETHNDSNNNVLYAMQHTYNQLNQLYQVLNQYNVLYDTYPLSGGYDGNGNSTLLVEAYNLQTQNGYDPLNRLIKTIHDYQGTNSSTANAITQYAYDTRDNLRSVTDPDNLITNYAYDGLNNLQQLQSPDTGTTNYIYDSAGNRTSQTDARGVLTTYSYDALNRLRTINYPTSSLNITYNYDQTNSTTGCAVSYPIGKLTSFSDSSGSTTYCYDQRGNILSKKQVVSTVTLTTVYAYTLADRLKSVTYPSGLVASYTRDTRGIITGVSYTPAGSQTQTALISSIAYVAFGPLSQITFANGRTLKKGIHSDGGYAFAFSSAADGLQMWISADLVGNIGAVSVASNSNPPTRGYHSDNLHRLIQVDQGGTAIEKYTYNKTGDRLSTWIGGVTKNYNYAAGTHRLISDGTLTYAYDNNGNPNQILGSTLISFGYDDRNRLSSAGFDGPKATYKYNGKGERVAKTANAPYQNSIFIYNESGALLGEYSSTGTLINEFVYADALPVAVTQSNGQVYYLETDHLGTPRVAVDPVRNVAVWKWDFYNSAFGTNATDQNPDGDSTQFALNLRFPGQYYDAESGFHYNYFRDYEPGTGRYVESDPIGLYGGPSTYAYVADNPLIYSDPDGLQSGGSKLPPSNYLKECDAADWKEAEFKCSPNAVLRCKRNYIRKLGAFNQGAPIWNYVKADLQYECDDKSFCQRNPKTCVAGLVVGVGIFVCTLPESLIAVPAM